MGVRGFQFMWRRFIGEDGGAASTTFFSDVFQARNVRLYRKLGERERGRGKRVFGPNETFSPSFLVLSVGCLCWAGTSALP